MSDHAGAETIWLAPESGHFSEAASILQNDRLAATNQNGVVANEPPAL